MKRPLLALVLVLFIFAGVVCTKPKPAIEPISKAETAFLFFGDWGTGGKEQREVAKGMQSFCANHTCDFAALLGDNFYPSGVKSVDDPQWKTKFSDIYGPLGLVFYVALGNHDYQGNTKAQIDYTKQSKIWRMDAAYFSYTFGGADFFVVDTNEKKFDAAQHKWLREGLANSKANWKIVYGHHPIFSYGAHGDTPYLVTDLLPVVENQADFYLCGHDHDLQVLKGSDRLNTIVSGAAAQLRPVKRGSRSQFAASALGFSHLQLKADSAVLNMLGKDGKPLFTQEYQHRAR